MLLEPFRVSSPVLAFKVSVGVIPAESPENGNIPLSASLERL